MPPTTGSVLERKGFLNKEQRLLLQLPTNLGIRLTAKTIKKPVGRAAANGLDEEYKN